VYYCKLECSKTPLIRTLVIPIGLALRVNLSRIIRTKLTCLEITSYRIKYSTVLLEFQIRRGRKVETQVLAVNSNRPNSNCQCSLTEKEKNTIIRIFCISGWFAVPINPDKWSSTIFVASSTVLPVVKLKKNVKQSRYRPGVTQRVPGS